MPDIVCLGILVADVLVKPVDQFPAVGSLQFVEDLSIHSGGCALNTGIALHKLGMDVHVWGQVGQDPFGDFLLDTLREAGLEVTGVERILRGTSTSVGLISHDGERTFLHYVGANATEPEHWSHWPNLPPARHLHIGGAFLLPGLDGEAMARLLADAKQRGMTTSVDTAYDGSGRWLDLLGPSLPYVDYFLPSEREAAALTKESTPELQSERLLALGVGTCGIKLGAGGCYLASGSERWRLPVLPVPVQDTTGAGDAWVAGFLAARLQGWPLPAAGLWGNAQGAAAVQAVGASQGVRDSEGLRALLRQYGRDEELVRYLTHLTGEGAVF